MSALVSAGSHVSFAEAKFSGPARPSNDLLPDLRPESQKAHNFSVAGRLLELARGVPPEVLDLEPSTIEPEVFTHDERFLETYSEIYEYLKRVESFASAYDPSTPVESLAAIDCRAALRTDFAQLKRDVERYRNQVLARTGSTWLSIQLGLLPKPITSSVDDR